MLQRTAKSCGPDAPTLVSSSRSCVGPTGFRQNLSADDGGKRARSPGRARHKPLKPLRAGMPGVPVYSLLLVCFLPMQSAHEAAGAVGTRHSPRPPWAKVSCTTRAHRVARRERVFGIDRHGDLPNSARMLWCTGRSSRASARSTPFNEAQGESRCARDQAQKSSARMAASA